MLQTTILCLASLAMPKDMIAEYNLFISGITVLCSIVLRHPASHLYPNQQVPEGHGMVQARNNLHQLQFLLQEAKLLQLLPVVSQKHLLPLRFVCISLIDKPSISSLLLKLYCVSHGLELCRYLLVFGRTV